jgi:predicted Zn-dependent peptidase
MKPIRAVLMLCALAATAGPLMAQRQTPPEGSTPRDFQLAEPRELTLPNGLKVVLVEYGQVPKATVSLVVRSGNANETKSQVWLADLTGDLMQEGTATRSAEQVANEAASMGGQVFVGVGLDQTTIQGDALSEFVPQMIALVADVVRNPGFPESELARLKGDLIRNVSIQRSQPQTQALEEFRRIMYPDHPYGRLYPDNGMIEGYTGDDVKSFYRANFGAQRSRIYVVGRFDVAAAERAIQNALGSWERGVPAATLPPKPVAQRQLAMIDRPNAPQSTIVMGLPTIDPTHPDYTRLVVTNTLLGGYFSSRITSNIREDKGYTYSPFSQISTRYHDGYWAQNADVTTAVTGASLKEIFFEIDRLRTEPPTPAELRAVQNYLAGSFILGSSTRGGIVGQLSLLDFQGLPRTYLTEYVKRVMATTPAEVQKAAQTYIDPAKMLIVINGDKKVIEEQVAPYRQVTP